MDWLKTAVLQRRTKVCRHCDCNSLSTVGGTASLWLYQSKYSRHWHCVIVTALLGIVAVCAGRYNCAVVQYPAGAW